MVHIVVINMSPARPKMPFGGDISLIYIRDIYEWELGGRGGGGKGGGGDRRGGVQKSKQHATEKCLS